MPDLKGEPKAGELVLLEICDRDALPETVKPYVPLNPQFVTYQGPGEGFQGLWFQVQEATLKGEVVTVGSPEVKEHDWGPFSFFIPWANIATLLRFERNPSGEKTICGFRQAGEAVKT